MGIQDQRCSEARVAGSSERWGPTICPAARDPSPGTGPAGSRRRGLAPLLGRSSQSRSGGAGGRRGGPTLSGGKTLPAGKRTSAGKGHSEESSPAPEPGTSREPRRMEQRRARGRKARGTGLGEREHNASLLVSVLLILNSCLFFYFYLKGIQ